MRIVIVAAIVIFVVVVVIVAIIFFLAVIIIIIIITILQNSDLKRTRFQFQPHFPTVVGCGLWAVAWQFGWLW